LPKQSNRSEVLNFYLNQINESELSPEQKQGLCKALKGVAEQFYRSGVKAGYLKILQDHRDGSIDLSMATPRQLNEAIRLAEDGELMPGTHLSASRFKR